MAPDASIVYASGAGTYEIKSVRPDGTHAPTLLKSERVVGNPSVSPNGRLVAFDRGTDNEVWLMNRDGSNAHFLTNGTTPSFSPDGTRLAVGGAHTAFNRYELDLVNLEGNGRQAGFVLGLAAHGLLTDAASLDRMIRQAEALASDLVERPASGQRRRREGRRYSDRPKPL